MEMELTKNPYVYTFLPSKKNPIYSDLSNEANKSEKRDNDVTILKKCRHYLSMHVCRYNVCVTDAIEKLLKSESINYVANYYCKVMHTRSMDVASVTRRKRLSIVSNLTLKKENIQRRYPKAYRTNNIRRKIIIKTETYKTILIAKPAYVRFHNFKVNVLYKKTVTLINVSNVLARFRLEPRPNYSRLLVTTKDANRIQNAIPPGMQVKLLISFRTDILNETEECIAVDVQNTKPIYIKVYCSRDPPILTAMGIPYVQSINSVSFSPLNESVSLSSKFSNLSMDEFTSNHNSSSTFLSDHSTPCDRTEKLMFECGKCFIGEKIELQMKLKNIGGDGKFFIMSEIDWCMMRIEDITDTNILILPPFMIWPAYFSLNRQEDIYLHMSFFPDIYGMHVDKLYIFADNCSTRSTEIIGDGIMYEPHYLEFSEQLKKDSLCLLNFDNSAKYHLDLGTILPNEVLQNSVSITNTSKMYMHFRWEKCHVRHKNQDVITNYQHLPLDCINVQPASGIFFPMGVLNFNITTEIRDLSFGKYFTVLELYVEDIPSSAVDKDLNLHIKNSKTKRRICLNSVDILIGGIEIWLGCVPVKLDMLMERFSISDENPYEAKTMSETECSLIVESCPRSEKIIDTTNSDRKRPSKTILLAEELFSSRDVVNTESMKLLMQKSIISSGILRPNRYLFVGITEIYTFTMKNVSCRTLLYRWGEAYGLDKSKMKLSLCPKSGSISVGITETIELTCVPIEVGPVRSLYVPCFIESSQNIMLLGIECTIESFYVTIHLPTAIHDTLGAYDDTIRVEWHVDSAVQEEQELMNIDLDEGPAKKDACVGSSLITNKESNIRDTFFNSQTGIKIDNYEDQQNNDTLSKFESCDDLQEENSEENLRSLSKTKILPFYKTVLPHMSQRIVIEFLKTPLRTVKKKTFTIRNETPILTNFDLTIKNFYPAQFSRKMKSKKETIISIYKKTLDRQMVNELWSQLKQLKSGILIYVDPITSRLGPYETVPIDIYVFADTWGIYTDQLEINIIGLPRYALGICVQVTELPISFLICKNTPLKTPILRFGTFRIGDLPVTRRVVMRNTSTVPLIVNWHTFLIESATIKPKPFNIILHLYTPFTNKLAIALRKATNENEVEKLTRHYCVTEEINSHDLRYNSVNFCAMSQNSSNDDEIYDVSSDNSTTINSTTDHTTQDIKYNFSDEIKESELKMELISYYGLIDTHICTIYPEEIFMPPNAKASAAVTLFPDKCPISKDNNNIACKALGFIRIAPMDKYKDNCYSRLDNYYLPPVQIDIQTKIVKPRLVYNISKFDKTFVFCAEDVMRNYKQKMMIKKTYIFHNREEGKISVKFQTNSPFKIESISTNEIFTREYIEHTFIEGWSCAEVEISCTINSTLIKQIVDTEEERILGIKSGTLKHDNGCFEKKGALIIVHLDSNIQIIDLFLKVHLPLLHLSSHSLNFGRVYIGDTKKLLLDIENLSACKQIFKVQKSKLNRDFDIEPNVGEVLARPVSGKHIFTITISFHPKSIGTSTEKLKITTSIPNYMEKCVLCGQGTLDENYHCPGI